MRNGDGVLHDNKVTSILLFSIKFFSMTSLFSLTSALFVDDVIKNRHFYVWYSNNDNLRTTYRRKVVDPSLESYYIAAFEKWGFTDPSCRWVGMMGRHYADVSTFWAEISKMTSRDVKWRHQVGFSPNFQEVFLLLTLSCGVNMKSFASFKRKLWAI